MSNNCAKPHFLDHEKVTKKIKMQRKVDTKSEHSNKDFRLNPPESEIVHNITKSQIVNKSAQFYRSWYKN